MAPFDRSGLTGILSTPLQDGEDLRTRVDSTIGWALADPNAFTIQNTTSRGLRGLPLIYGIYGSLGDVSKILDEKGIPLSQAI